MNRTWSCVIATLMLLGPTVAQAQVVKATAADSVLVANNIYRRLFDGITLSDDQRVRALAIIRKAFLAKLELRGDYNQIMPKVTALETKRDSALKTLISSDADKKKFEEHVLTNRP